ncbi:MAG: spondin domain-containing protein [Methylococcales bacterium]
MIVYRKIYTILCCSVFLLAVSTSIGARELNVTIENLSPVNGINLTPFWIGFHDGSFDLYDLNQPASAALQPLAEDGVSRPISTLFVNSNRPGVEATITEPGGFAGAPVFDPGRSATLKIDVEEATGRYFSYASMIIPSNDAFIANGDPLEHEIFNLAGEFVGPISFIVWGHQVLDAGSEKNTETNAAFLNQSVPNTGDAENGTVQLHEGFNGSIANPSAVPVNILGGTNAAGALIDPTNADFKQANYPVARITISEPGVPVRVNVTNLSPAGGLYNTPLWVGFHNGEFDSYSRGELASAELERMAEDGDTAELSNAFGVVATTGLDGVITEPDGFAGAPVFDPGSKAQQVFLLDSSAQRYFSYATMIIPSNDAFVANGDPKAHQLFDETGAFTGPVNIHIMGANILDAGSEVNTETDAAFLNQASANIGQAEQGVVAVHPGFNGSSTNPGGTPQNILGGKTPAGTVIDPQLGDFTTPGSQILRISVNRAVDWSFSGLWYDPLRDGEGFLMAVSGDVNPVATLTWYTFSTDGTGQQVWIIGTAPILGETAIFEMFRAEGATFGAGFSSADVNNPYWGQIHVDFSNCNHIIATYDAQVSDFGTGTMNLQRLTPVLSNVTGACQ